MLRYSIFNQSNTNWCLQVMKSFKINVISAQIKSVKIESSYLSKVNTRTCMKKKLNWGWNMKTWAQLKKKIKGQNHTHTHTKIHALKVNSIVELKLNLPNPLQVERKALIVLRDGCVDWRGMRERGEPNSPFQSHPSMADQKSLKMKN